MRTTTLKSHLLAVLMLLTGISAFAYDFEYEGLYYNILSEEDKTVEVTYQKCLIGPTYSYCNPAAIGNVEIPSKVLFKSKTYHVIAIGIYAFRNDEGYGNRLTSVTIPNSVTSIDHMAFKGCSDLIDIHVDSDNQYYSSIDGILFNKDVTILIKCPEKKELVVIPNSVTSIGYMAFYYCRGLTSLTIGNSVTSIGDEAFYGCNRLTSLTIGNSASIGREAFCGCSRLASVTIGNSVTSIGNYAFSGCTGLTSVTIGNSASIGNRAFFGCSGLTSVTIGNSETIGNFTASIGDEAFCDCKSLTSVTIGNSVTSIGDWAFSGCSGLTSLTIGNSVTSIGNYAFSNCHRLTSLTIPSSVIAIGSFAFASSFFSSIYCQALTPPLNSIYGTATDPIFNGSTYEYAKLYVPIGCRYAYKKAFLWKSFWNIEEMDFSGINEVAAEDIGIFVQDGVVHIDNADENTLVEVFDISGKNVYRGYDNVVSGLAKGIYVVRICGNSTKIAL